MSSLTLPLRPSWRRRRLPLPHHHPQVTSCPVARPDRGAGQVVGAAVRGVGNQVPELAGGVVFCVLCVDGGGVGGSEEGCGSGGVFRAGELVCAAVAAVVLRAGVGGAADCCQGRSGRFPRQSSFHHRLPSQVKKVFHPIVCCLLFAEVAAVTFAYFSHSGFDVVLGNYLTKVPSNPGAGDILMWFLGSVVIQFAFFMFKQRKLIKRHAPEIFSSVIITAIFSLYSTAIIGRLVGLEPTLTISILPRCITVALALSIASLFEDANASLTAAMVVLTGLVGANFAQTVMDKLRLHDPIARGIATASSSHGLGTSGLSAKEPEALPFCAIAYSLTGIFATLFCSVPVVRQSFLLIVG